jgi:hypothetical protein
MIIIEIRTKLKVYHVSFKFNILKDTAEAVAEELSVEMNLQPQARDAIAN